MKQRFFLVLFLLTILSSVQLLKNTSYNCSIIVDIDFKGIIDLFDRPGGKILKKLNHDLGNEDYLLFDIIGKNDSMFYVKANYSINGIIAKGWIKKRNNSLGIYSKAYSGNLNLYQKPFKNSKINVTIEKYTPQLFQVTDSQNNWLLVEIEISGKKHKGWMAPEMQCSNPYSTCN